MLITGLAIGNSYVNKHLNTSIRLVEDQSKRPTWSLKPDWSKNPKQSTQCERQRIPSSSFSRMEKLGKFDPQRPFLVQKSLEMYKEHEALIGYVRNAMKMCFKFFLRKGKEIKQNSVTINLDRKTGCSFVYILCLYMLFNSC